MGALLGRTVGPESGTISARQADVIYQKTALSATDHIWHLV